MGAMLNFSSAASAAGNSMAFGQQATAFDTAGALMKGLGAFQQASYAAQVASNNAAIQLQNAGAARSAGMEAEEASKLHYGLLEGQQKAAQGANGVDVNVGSPLAVRQTTGKLSEIDAALIHYNTSRQVYSLMTEANADKAQSTLYKDTALGSLFGGIAQAGGTLLSGAASTAARRAAFGLSGADSSSNMVV